MKLKLVGDFVGSRCFFVESAQQLEATCCRGDSEPFRFHAWDRLVSDSVACDTEPDLHPLFASGRKVEFDLWFERLLGTGQRLGQLDF